MPYRSSRRILRGTSFPRCSPAWWSGRRCSLWRGRSINTLHSEDLEQDEAWRYDVNRINELRRQDLVYRVFHPLVQLFARFNRLAFREYLPEIGREIQAAGLPRFWTAEEYLGKLEVIALFLAPAYLYAFVEVMGPAGSVMAFVLTVLTGWLLRRRLAEPRPLPAPADQTPPPLPARSADAADGSRIDLHAGPRRGR